nr:hypothetical protein [Tanacetum cinerariifolium]
MLPSLPEAALRLRQHLSQFAPLSDEDWGLLVPHLRLVPLARHAVFAEQGRVATELGFVLDGMFRQYYIKDGEERTSYFFFEDQLIGGYFSSLTGRPSLVTIEALSAGCCLTFPYAVLVDLFSPAGQRRPAHPGAGAPALHRQFSGRDAREFEPHSYPHRGGVGRHFLAFVIVLGWRSGGILPRHYPLKPHETPHHSGRQWHRHDAAAAGAATARRTHPPGVPPSQ